MNTQKAVLVGINYPNTSHSLNGCWNDVDLIQDLLINKYNYTKRDILILRDNDNKDEPTPTANEMFNAFDWLICQKCDVDGYHTCDHRVSNEYNGSNRKLFFSFSGHGTNFRDRDGDENDGMDEAIVCTDYCITDDLLYTWLVSKIPRRDSLVCVLDCCNSGTLLDLKTSYYPGDTSENVVLRMNSGKYEVKGDVTMISGCRDEQTSADAYIRTSRSYQGALTHGLTGILNKTPEISIGKLLNDINNYMKKEKYTQRPVISVDGETLPYRNFF